eukprot:CAMPEP_0113845204 /NCGR_PEP_ID=MMETSP0372-20130328/630_1 /TAXON_ID=340204 /ORGANISM="Lankesteria abbotti" /LENGTH=1035 /DNA_ID=CAMNT_0000814227 /DNA_START=99 /DNA_END=3206 /DNA_ORIENTATION=- /assembly_acc=CAM_ASM_000359
MGKCKMKDGCNYAHTEAELRRKPDLSCTKLCPSVEKGKECVNASCRYAHKQSELRATSIFHKTKMCKHWKNGKCSGGVTCRHAHGDNDIRSPDDNLHQQAEFVTEARQSGRRHAYQDSRCRNDRWCGNVNPKAKGTKRMEKTKSTNKRNAPCSVDKGKVCEVNVASSVGCTNGGAFSDNSRRNSLTSADVMPTNSTQDVNRGIQNSEFASPIDGAVKKAHFSGGTTIYTNRRHSAKLDVANNRNTYVRGSMSAREFVGESSARTSGDALGSGWCYERSPDEDQVPHLDCCPQPLTSSSSSSTSNCVNSYHSQNWRHVSWDDQRQPTAYWNSGLWDPCNNFPEYEMLGMVNSCDQYAPPYVGDACDSSAARPKQCDFDIGDQLNNNPTTANGNASVNLGGSLQTTCNNFIMPIEDSALAVDGMTVDNSFASDGLSTQQVTRQLSLPPFSHSNLNPSTPPFVPGENFARLQRHVSIPPDLPSPQRPDVEQVEQLPLSQCEAKKSHVVNPTADVSNHPEVDIPDLPAISASADGKVVVVDEESQQPADSDGVAGTDDRFADLLNQALFESADLLNCVLPCGGRQYFNVTTDELPGESWMSPPSLFKGADGSVGGSVGVGCDGLFENRRGFRTAVSSAVVGSKPAVDGGRQADCADEALLQCEQTQRLSSATSVTSNKDETTTSPQWMSPFASAVGSSPLRVNASPNIAAVTSTMTPARLSPTMLSAVDWTDTTTAATDSVLLDSPHMVADGVVVGDGFVSTLSENVCLPGKLNNSRMHRYSDVTAASSHVIEALSPPRVVLGKSDNFDDSDNDPLHVGTDCVDFLNSSHLSGGTSPTERPLHDCLESSFILSSQQTSADSFPSSWWSSSQQPENAPLPPPALYNANFPSALSVAQGVPHDTNNPLCNSFAQKMPSHDSNLSFLAEVAVLAMTDERTDPELFMRIADILNSPTTNNQSASCLRTEVSSLSSEPRSTIDSFNTLPNDLMSSLSSSPVPNNDWCNFTEQQQTSHTEENADVMKTKISNLLPDKLCRTPWMT